jgi:hypothetical protein
MYEFAKEFGSAEYSAIIVGSLPAISTINPRCLLSAIC